jgi:transcriptional regulator
MYTPDANAVTDEAELDALLRNLRLGVIVTHDDAGGLFASHLPFSYDPDRRLLAGHLAIANPHAHRPDGLGALAIFQGVDAYVSPSWYPSKFKHGKVVPTWNYEAVHIHGRLTWRRDESWLLSHLGALTDHYEAGRLKPWALNDAPEDYLKRQVSKVVGLELTLDRVHAKRKLSQNRDKPDRLGVIAGLSASDDPKDRAVAEAMLEDRRRNP